MTTVKLIDGTEADSNSEAWRRDNERRLLSHAAMIPIAGCWIWLGAMGGNGYGSTWLTGRVVGAHRAAWLVWRGEIPSGKHVCHRCDVRQCINPDHLFLGTRTENMRDAVSKGRIGHHTARLTFKDAEAIRGSQARGVELAKRYGVSQNIICNIRSGRSYRRRHVLGDPS